MNARDELLQELLVERFGPKPRRRKLTDAEKAEFEAAVVEAQQRQRRAALARDDSEGG